MASELLSKGAPFLLAAAFVTYRIGLVVYRLYFHPLRKFPGPKIAAVSTLYEAYFQIWLKGQYYREISRLHDLYGPIIRVTPDELHIRDSRFFEQFYGKNTPLEKPGWEVKFGAEEGGFTTVNPTIHKRRRGALSPMFSRRSILDFIHIVHGHVETLSQRLDESQTREEPLNLTLAFHALTGDVIMDYSFGFNYSQLKHPEFYSFHEAFLEIGGSGHVATLMPWIAPLMDNLPDSVAGWLKPAAKSVLKYRRDTRALIIRTLAGESTKVNDAKRTIFEEILSADLPPEDKTIQRLVDESQIILGAGVLTTAFALSIASFHIITNPHIYARLHADLVAAFPNRTALDLLTLEKMPYLKACIMEGLRLGYGLSARNPRARRTPLVYKDWVIPAGSCVSMSIPDVSHDPTIFPQSTTFEPERWLSSPAVTPTGEPLERFMVSFGRGTRSCLGITLAWTELYLTLGMMMRRYSFEVVEPDVRDVQLGHDNFVPVPREESKGVRVFVRESKD